MGRVTAGEQLAGQQDGVAGLPGLHLFRGHRVQVDALGALVVAPGDLRPLFQVRSLEIRRAGAVEDKVGVAGGGAVGDDRHRLVGRVGGVIRHLHVQHRGQAAQALGADAQGVDLLEQLQAQFLGTGLRAPRLQLVDVDGVHQGLLGDQHGLLGGAADADAEHARRAPAGAHLRHLLEHPVDHRIGRVEHGELGLRLGAAALGRHVDFNGVAGHDGVVDHRRRVVLGVGALAVRVRQHRGAQHVVRVVVGPAHALVDHVVQAHVALERHVHAHLAEHGDDAGVLADRPAPHGGHAGIHQNLRHGVLGRFTLFPLVGFLHRADKVHRVVVRDVLQGIGNALNQIVLADHRHGGTPDCWDSGRAL